MTERSRNIAVGLTTVVGFVGLVFLLVLFGSVPAMLEKGYVIKVELEAASGLNPGSRVRLLGKDIGRVSQVELYTAPGKGLKVMVTTQIRHGILIPKAVRVKADAPLLGGSPALAFEMQPNALPDDLNSFLPTDGSAIIQGQSLTLVSQFAGELKAAIREPTERFNEVAADFHKLSQAWTEVGKNITDLTASRSTADVDAGKAAPNLATVLVRTDQRLKEMQKTIDAINAWVADEELHRNVLEVSRNARKITERVDGSLDKADRLIDDTRTNIDALAKRYLAVADDMSGTIRSMQKTLDQAREGKGTVGQLLQDPALYNNLNDSAQRLKAVLDELRLLIEKWKKEGLPVQF